MTHLLRPDPDRRDRLDPRRRPRRLAEFRAWSEGIIQSFNPFRTEEQTKEMEAASEALNDYFSRPDRGKPRRPGDDLISDMVRLQAEGAPLSRHSSCRSISPRC